MGGKNRKLRISAAQRVFEVGRASRSAAITAKASKGPGRPKGSKNAKTLAAAKSTKRRLSPEGRKRIADAMKRRWAERRKAAAKTPAAAK